MNVGFFPESEADRVAGVREEDLPEALLSLRVAIVGEWR
jgi:hypothetical protein